MILPEATPPVTHVPVLIVGGGVAGLVASALLARQGVRCLLVERHPGTSIHPRARGVNGRTMEILRGLGLEDAIRSAGAAIGPSLGFLFGESFAGAMEKKGRPGWIERWIRARASGQRSTSKSPTTACRITQDHLEPLLLQRARALGAVARFSTELVAWAQDDHGVTGTLLDRPSGRRETVRADWLIAADGARSPAREALGVSRSGAGALSHQLNVYLRADLGALVRGREPSMVMVEQPGLRGLFASVNNTDLWVLHLAWSPDQESLESWTPARCAETARRAIGLDVPVEIKGVMPWESAVRVADGFRHGRVLLAGDAAHVMPPWGGFGANTAIQDVHNLAWKLALVHRGLAHERLLDTYDAERRPVATAVSSIAGSMNDARGLMKARSLGQMFWGLRRAAPYFTVGYGYNSEAILPEGHAGPGTTDLSGRPGTRVPHLEVDRDGARVSTLDLCGDRFTLLAGRDGAGWRAGSHRVPVDVLVAGADFQGPWERAAGISRDGALLVRPDGFVAWRARRGPDPGALAGALDRLVPLDGRGAQQVPGIV